MAANQTVSVYGTVLPYGNKFATTTQKKSIYGLNFPLGSDRFVGGFFKKESGINLIRDAVTQLLLVERGERVMLPSFGCNLRRFLFQPLDESTFEAIKQEIMYSFERYIVGARILKLKVFPLGETGPAGGNSLKVILVLQLADADLTVFDVEVQIK